jgi:hypothetical protein
MGDKIIKASKWLGNRTLIEKIIIHFFIVPFIHNRSFTGA